MNKNETIADIVAEMRIFKCCNLETGELELCTAIANYFANRLEAAHEREVEKLNSVIQAQRSAFDAEIDRLRREQVGNSAKMREALENCANMGEQIDCQLGSSDATVYAFRHERCLAHNISECARAALAAPARNCDVGDADDWDIYAQTALSE